MLQDCQDAFLLLGVNINFMLTYHGLHQTVWTWKKHYGYCTRG